MRKKTWLFLCSFAVITVAAMLYGCGQENETNVPVVKLTASTITSQPDASTHTHPVSIPFTDVSAVPASDLYQYRSEVSNGHSHVIALSKLQMIDLNNGQRLVLTSLHPILVATIATPGTSRGEACCMKNSAITVIATTNADIHR